MKLPEYGDIVLLKWPKTGASFVGEVINHLNPNKSNYQNVGLKQFSIVVRNPNDRTQIRYVSPDDRGGNPEITILNGKKNDQYDFYHDFVGYNFGPQ